jgi:hypothetical protein
LASGNVREAYVTNHLGDDRKGDTMPLTEYDTGALLNTPPLPAVPMGSNPLPISAIVSAESISTPYFIEQNINGLTDLVLTYPMRRYGIYNGGQVTNQLNQDQAACEGTLNDGVDDGQTVHLTSVSATVHDFPHDDLGKYCNNTGYVEIGDSSDYYSYDVSLTIEQFDYEADHEQIIFNDVGWTLPPIDALPTPVLILQRAVNINSLFLAQPNNSPTLFGTPLANRTIIDLFPGLYKEAGWLQLQFIGTNNYSYDYELNASIRDLTEAGGGLAVDNSWRGVPVIGFAAMYSELQSGYLGETIELQRQTNRQ